MLDTYDWYLLPIHNPDGYEYSRNYVRMNTLLINKCSGRFISGEQQEGCASPKISTYQ